jgi:hypothetical protein
MSQYITGTVNVKNANSTVIGVGTVWQTGSNVTSDHLFIVSGDTVSYQVAAVVSNTEITLSAPYAGANANSANYAVHRDFTPIHDLPILNRGDTETAVLWKRLVQILDSII